MAIELEARPEALVPQRDPVTVMRSSKEEEGPVKGELWAVLRAFSALIGVIMVIGYLVA